MRRHCALASSQKGNSCVKQEKNCQQGECRQITPIHIAGPFGPALQFKRPLSAHPEEWERYADCHQNTEDYVGPNVLYRAAPCFKYQPDCNYHEKKRDVKCYRLTCRVSQRFLPELKRPAYWAKMQVCKVIRPDADKGNDCSP